MTEHGKPAIMEKIKIIITSKKFILKKRKSKIEMELLTPGG